jgi:hypothetical protein
MLDFPVILHRPLPDDAVLQELTVKRRKNGNGFEWSVTLQFRKSLEAAEHTSPLTCGINLGWKVTRQGIRVATVQDSLGKTEHITLPPSIQQRLDYVDKELKPQVDTLTNENIAWIKQVWMDGLPGELQDSYQRIRQTPKNSLHPNQFARAVIAWRQVPGFKPALLEEAERRRKQVKRIMQEEATLRTKTINCRRDFYQKLTKRLAEKYSVMTLDKMDLAQLAKREREGGLPSDLTDRAKRNRVVAALSELREWLGKQAAKTGAQVVYQAIKSTYTCSLCGADIPEQDTLQLLCEECVAVIDRDKNAATNLLNAA